MVFVFVNIVNAKVLKLEEEVAFDIQSLIDETVNGGDQTAYVIYKGNKPEVDCKVSLDRVNTSRRWAFCIVQFKVKFEDLRGTNQCKLLYSFNPSKINKTLERANEDLFTKCIERLSESL